MVSAYVRNSEDPGFGQIISLGAFKCRKVLFKALSGEQYLLLADQRRVAQLRCIGEDIRVDPFAIEIVEVDFPFVDSNQRLVRQFANLYRNRRLSNPRTGWTVEGMRHRDALAALDARRSGASYREIAVFLYGEKAVREDWTDPGQLMKNRVIRSVKRGYRMMEGGYKSLLQ